MNKRTQRRDVVTEKVNDIFFRIDEVLTASELELKVANLYKVFKWEVYVNHLQMTAIQVEVIHHLIQEQSKFESNFSIIITDAVVMSSYAISDLHLESTLADLEALSDAYVIQTLSHPIHFENHIRIFHWFIMQKATTV